MRDACEVKLSDQCEVYTRCVAVHVRGRLKLSCPTCAEALGAPADIIAQMVRWDLETDETLVSDVAMPMPTNGGHLYVPVTAPHPPTCPHMLVYVDAIIGEQYGSGVALSQ